MAPDPSRVNSTEETWVPADPTKDTTDIPAGTQQSGQIDGRRGRAAWILLWQNLKRALPVFFLAAIIALGATVWFERVYLLDWVRLRGYHPSDAMTRLASQTNMTPYAKRLLYVNHPALEDKDQFNRDCPDAAQEVAVLGCFRGDRQGIHVYRVTDARLSGVEQVTTAHEMLHQAYVRLSKPERTRIDNLLESYVKTITDQNILDKINTYRKLEPNAIDDEMHSVIGTEVGNLPAPLESYYTQYFANRAVVVAFRNQYQLAFTERQQQIAAYDLQIGALKAQIDSAQADINDQEKSLKAQRAQMDQWLAANQTSQYNAAVPGFNAQVDAYRQKVNSTNDLINQYNSLVDRRNAIAVQTQELLKAEDSRAATSAAVQ